MYIDLTHLSNNFEWTLPCVNQKNSNVKWIELIVAKKNLILEREKKQSILCSWVWSLVMLAPAEQYCNTQTLGKAAGSGL